jgi:hypothetical protein
MRYEKLKKSCKTQKLAIFALILMIAATGCATFEPSEQLNPPEPSSVSEDSTKTTDGSINQLADQVTIGTHWNSRSCELLPVYRHGTTFSVEVWVSADLHDCPEEAWAAIDAEALKDELGATMVITNGPRYALMDSFEVLGGVAAEGQTASFAGLPMKLAATLEWQAADLLSLRNPYSINEVNRHTVFTFNAGREVYVLIDAEGNQYIMQSYALIVDPTLTIADLATLGERLELPEGWQYEVLILDEDYYAATDGNIPVVSDELRNSYQLLTEPIFEESGK